jgi:hypothetical protein
MKIIRPFTYLHVLTSDDRIRHARVETVVDQDEITVSIGKDTPFTAERVSSTATRGTIFEEV